MIRKITPFLIGLIVLFVFFIPFFIQVRIECRSQFGSCPNEIGSQLNQFSGKNLFQARNKTFGYLKKNFLVNDFTIQYKIPNILEVNLLIKKPEFAILDKASGKFGLIGKDGTVISIQPDSALPTVSVENEELKIGSKVGVREFFALELMQGIWAMYQVRLGEIQGDSLVVELPGPVKVILPEEGDRDVLLGEIRLVYGKVESPDTSGKYSEIDLRFKNPVLR